MPANCTFEKVSDQRELQTLRNKWVDSLSSPPDGMWESFRKSATHWAIRFADKRIGYACVDANHRLIQFYLLPPNLPRGTAIFKLFIKSKNINEGIVGTNNPIYLSLALSFFKKLEIHTYLFRKYFEVDIDKKEGDLKGCLFKDLDKVVDFYHYSTGASKSWLAIYIGGLIKKREVFTLVQEGEIIGSCEVRTNATATEFADIGMVVSPDHRKKGYGTYLLHQAKIIALRSKKMPICSCKQDNIGSLKSIHNNGFISTYQLLRIVFN